MTITTKNLCFDQSFSIGFYIHLVIDGQYEDCVLTQLQVMPFLFY